MLEYGSYTGCRKTHLYHLEQLLCERRLALRPATGVWLAPECDRVKGVRASSCKGMEKQSWQQRRDIQSYSYLLVVRKSSVLRYLHSFSQKCPPYCHQQAQFFEFFLALTHEIGAQVPLSIMVGNCFSGCWSPWCAVSAAGSFLPPHILYLSSQEDLKAAQGGSPNTLPWVSCFLWLLPALGSVSSRDKHSLPLPLFRSLEHGGDQGLA